MHVHTHTCTHTHTLLSEAELKRDQQEKDVYTVADLCIQA